MPLLDKILKPIHWYGSEVKNLATATDKWLEYAASGNDLEATKELIKMLRYGTTTVGVPTTAAVGYGYATREKKEDLKDILEQQILSKMGSTSSTIDLVDSIVKRKSSIMRHVINPKKRLKSFTKGAATTMLGQNPQQPMPPKDYITPELNRGNRRIPEGLKVNTETMNQLEKNPHRPNIEAIENKVASFIKQAGPSDWLKRGVGALKNKGQGYLQAIKSVPGRLGEGATNYIRDGAKQSIDSFVNMNEQFAKMPKQLSSIGAGIKTQYNQGLRGMTGSTIHENIGKPIGQLVETAGSIPYHAGQVIAPITGPINTARGISAIGDVTRGYGSILYDRYRKGGLRAVGSRVRESVEDIIGRKLPFMNKKSSYQNLHEVFRQGFMNKTADMMKQGIFTRSALKMLKMSPAPVAKTQGWASGLKAKPAAPSARLQGAATKSIMNEAAGKVKPAGPVPQTGVAPIPPANPSGLLDRLAKTKETPEAVRSARARRQRATEDLANKPKGPTKKASYPATSSEIIALVKHALSIGSMAGSIQKPLLKRMTSKMPAFGKPGTPPAAKIRMPQAQGSVDSAVAAWRKPAYSSGKKPN